MRASTKERGKGHTQTHPRRGHVTTEAENGEMRPQVKEHEERPETGRGREPLEPSQGAGPANTLFSDFWPPGCERINFYCLKPPSVW